MPQLRCFKKAVTVIMERLDLAFVQEKAADFAPSSGFIKCRFSCALIFESCMHQYRNLYCFIHVVLVHAPNVSKNIFIISMCVAACTSIFFSFEDLSKSEVRIVRCILVLIMCFQVKLEKRVHQSYI